jgi:hypothetical protein
MVYDGESISLVPSIGNWNSVCRSHYIIRQGNVIEADSWSDQQVENEHRRDRLAKSRFYSEAESATRAPEPLPYSQTSDSAEHSREADGKRGLLASIMAWLQGKGFN